MTETARREWIDYGKSLAMSGVFSIPISLALSKGTAIPVAVLINGTIFGTSIHVAKNIQYRIQFRSFLSTLAVQWAFLFSVVVLCFTLSVGSYAVLAGAPLFSAKTWSEVIGLMLQPQLVTAVCLTFAGISVVSGIFQVSRKLGPGVLRSWMFGKYHDPSEEERIFMFLDMKDSTMLAERMGNLAFSRLVRDFMADLTGPVIESRGEVSHYIGDEAVLTWTLKNGLRDGNCLRLFFRMQDALAKRADHYMSAYGFVPGFKAGAHVGLVVACEVGEIKSEIVFHGDVLNTSARIQGLCNELNEPFLISGALAGRVGPTPQLAYSSLGSHTLKGKEEVLEIVAVRNKDGGPPPQG